MITPAINIGQLSNDSTQQVVSDGSVYSGGERPLTAVFLFAKLTLDSVDYPMQYLQGNLQNPLVDTFWNVPISSNGLYTFYIKIIYLYSPTALYSNGDWIFDPNTNWLWVSLQNTNVGNGFNSAYWRVYANTDFQTIATKTSNGLANTFFSASGTSNIVSNTHNHFFVNIERTALSLKGSPNFQDITPQYDPILAPNGYGGPNPVRTQLPFAMFYVFQKSTGILSQMFILTNAMLDQSFDLDNINDGCYQVQLFIPLVYSSSNAYPINQVVYDTVSGNFYTALQAVPTLVPLTNPAYWKISQYQDFIDSPNTMCFITDCIEKLGMEQYLVTIGYRQVRKKTNYNNDEFRLWCKLDMYYQLSKIAFDNKQLMTSQLAIEDFQANMVPNTTLPALV